MTRIQVARRLGISKTSVRRLEGRELTPYRTGRGVVFDSIEVEAYANSRPRRAASTDTLVDEIRAVVARHHGVTPESLDATVIILTSGVSVTDRAAGTAVGTIGSPECTAADRTPECIADDHASEMLRAVPSRGSAAGTGGFSECTADKAASAMLQEAPHDGAAAGATVSAECIVERSASDATPTAVVAEETTVAEEPDDGVDLLPNEPWLFVMLARSPMDLRSACKLVDEHARGVITREEAHALMLQVAEAAPKRLVAATYGAEPEGGAR